MHKEKRFLSKKQEKKIQCVLLTIVLVACYILPQFELVAYAQSAHTDVTESCIAEVIVINAWEGGYQAEVTITNIGDKQIFDWKIYFNSEDALTDVWNCSMTSSDNGLYTIASAEWNSVINPGESVSVGFTATYVTEADYINDVRVTGVIISESETANDEEIIVKAGDVYLFEESDYTVKYYIDNVWEGNYTAHVEIINKTNVAIENWMISFLCENELSNIYNATIVKHEEDLYQIKNVAYNQDIPANGFITFGFQVTYEDKIDIPHPYIVYAGEQNVASEVYEIVMNITNQWENGYTGEIVITNLGDKVIEDWSLIFESEDEIVNVWDGQHASESDEYDVIYAPEHHQNISAGESIIVGFQAVGTVRELLFHGLYQLSHEDTDKEADDENDNNTNNDTDIEDNVSECEILIDTDDFRSADMEDMYYVENEVTCLTGELIGYEKISELKYILKDANEYVLLEGIIFDDKNGMIPVSEWKIDSFGLALGCNILTMEAILKDGSVITESITLIDMTGNNMERVNVDLSDSDSDGINNYFESILQTDANLADTDGDGLSDYDEFILLGTNPLQADADANGVTDDKEDYDEDGLNTIEEKTYNTNILMADTDYDGLNDGDEIRKYFSDPLVSDTDGDGLLDGKEVTLGFDPTLPDSDADGIMDYDEVAEQTATVVVGDENASVTEVAVTLDCSGAIEENVYIEDMTGRNAVSCDVVGLVGSPINVHTDLVFDEAVLTFQYNQEMLGDVLEENLGVLWYDEENGQYVLMDDVTVNADDDIVTCVTTHFSEYMLVDKEEWYSVWTQASEYVPTYAPCDIAIVSDSTAASAHFWTKGLGYASYENGFIEGEHVIYGYFNAERVRTIQSSWATNQTMLNEMISNALYYHLYTGGILDKGDLNGKYGDGFELMVELFSNEYYQMLNSNNPKVVLFTYDGYLLETEEQNQKVADCLEKLKCMGVVVYALSETGQTNAIIENAAIESGGEHWNLLTRDEDDQIWSRLHEAVSDPEKDSDGDGLPDNYEIQGMRIQNGRVITTDPNNPDTDGDNRTDGEEMGEQVKITVEVNGEGTKQNFTVFKMVSNPNVPDTLSGGFIYVDSLDYLPTNDNIYKDMYVYQVTDDAPWSNSDPVDRNGNLVYGLENLYFSLDYTFSNNENNAEYNNFYKLLLDYTIWLIAVESVINGETLTETAQGNLPAKLLEHFLCNTGTSVKYDGNLVSGSNLSFNLLTNLYSLKAECINVLNENDIRYISTSPYTNWTALDVTGGKGLEQILSAVTNFTAFSSVNIGKAAMVAECRFDGYRYEIYYTYYIIDYYDWDPLIMPRLYTLNTFGLAHNFLSFGVLEGYATFTIDNDNIFNFVYPTINI